MTFYAWVAAGVVLNLLVFALLVTGPAQPWLFVADAALLVALVGAFHAWRTRR